MLTSSSATTFPNRWKTFRADSEVGMCIRVIEAWLIRYHQPWNCGDSGLERLAFAAFRRICCVTVNAYRIQEFQ
jgi:hypothetical protein